MSDTNTTAGIFAAVFAPFFMTLGFIVWDIEWNKAGGSAFALNMFKCNLASIAFLIMGFTAGFSIDDSKEDQLSMSTYDNITNVDKLNSLLEIEQLQVFTYTKVGFLILSSTLGIIVGDSAWLASLKRLGATRVLVVDTLKPFLAAGLGRWILGEQINLILFFGMFLTIVGVLIVSLEDNKKSNKKDKKIIHELSCESKPTQQTSESISTIEEVIEEEKFVSETNGGVIQGIDTITKKGSKVSFLVSCFDPNMKNVNTMSQGYIFATINIVLDTYGSILTKQFGVGMTTWAINLIRFGFAGVVMALLSIVLTLRKCFKNKNETSITSILGSEEAHENAVKQNVAAKTNPVSAKSMHWFQLPVLSCEKWARIALGVAFVTFICPGEFISFQCVSNNKYYPKVKLTVGLILWKFAVFSMLISFEQLRIISDSYSIGNNVGFTHTILRIDIRMVL